jgi:hypothetical protein
MVFGSSANTLTFTTTFALAMDINYETAQGLANNTFTYNPLTQGAITSIDASVMKDLTVSFSVVGSGSIGNNFRPTILQDGTYYMAAIPGPSLSTFPSSTGYHLLAQAGLNAADFVSFDFTTGSFGTGNPNFGGDPMLFGLTQITTHGRGVYSGQVIAQYQDLSFDIHTVPEPGPLALLGTALLGFVGFAGRKAFLERRAATGSKTRSS